MTEKQIRQQTMEAGGFGPRVMMGMKVCLHCGTAGGSSQFFCRACGHRLPRHSLYHRYQEAHRCCPLCDTVVSQGAKYCPQCEELLMQTAVK